MDTETSSGDRNTHTKNVWEGTVRIAGFSIMLAGGESALYVPLDHHERYACQLCRKDIWLPWLGSVMAVAKAYVNHNLKYDLHALYRNGIDIIETPLEDTSTLAKLVDSDRAYKGGYGLTAVADWQLGEDIAGFERKLRAELSEFKRKGGKPSLDYGDASPRTLGEYCNGDIIAVDKVYPELLEDLPEISKQVWETEKLITTELAWMERTGMQTDMLQLVKLRGEMTTSVTKTLLRAGELAGYSFNPGSSDEVKDLLVNTFGLRPPDAGADFDAQMASVEAGDMEFEDLDISTQKHLLRLYALQEHAPIELIDCILTYRRDSKFISSFLSVFLSAQDNAGRLHGTYNQCVRTGRLSCSRPNSMQFNYPAKALIIPPKGYTIVRSDESNIEYRLITHYTREPRIFKAFQRDPDTDFHQLTADAAGVSRKVAKVLNFLISYTGRLRRFTQEFSLNLAFRKEYIEEARKLTPDASLKLLDKLGLDLLKKDAKQHYRKYHEGFPTLQQTQERLKDIAWANGCIVNIYGRVRRLARHVEGLKWSPTKDALNTVCQGGAADIVKEIMLRSSTAALRKAGMFLVGQVHDELMWYVKDEIVEDPRFFRDLAYCMEAAPRLALKPLTVRLRCKFGSSKISWADAASNENERSLPVEEVDKGGFFEWLS